MVCCLVLGAAVMLAAAADTDQDGSVTIAGLSHWFGPVAFPHDDHGDMVDDCTDCHHHADGETETCDTCHPASFDTSDPELPPLNVAYHQRCAACHVEVGGPTDCEGCHARRALPEGPALRGYAAP